MRYTLRQLQVFLSTARHQNITRAAQELAMSQSAASSALKELESQFDIALFDRLGKRLQLSSLGESLRPQAQHLVDQALALEAALAGETDAGTLHVGATLTIGNYLALSMVAEFRRRFSKAQVDLQIANTRDIVERVASYELDIGLIEGEVSHQQLAVRHWRRDELVVFAAKDHPLTKKRRVNDAALIAEPWILREPGSGTRQTFDRAMQGLYSELNIAMELQQPKAIKRAVEEGLGIGCLSRISLEDSFSRGTLKPLKVPQRNFQREWFVITHRDKFHSGALKQWLSLCDDYREGSAPLPSQ